MNWAILPICQGSSSQHSRDDDRVPARFRNPQPFLGCRPCCFFAGACIGVVRALPVWGPTEKRVVITHASNNLPHPDGAQVSTRFQISEPLVSVVCSATVDQSVVEDCLARKILPTNVHFENKQATARGIGRDLSDLTEFCTQFSPGSGGCA
jgi:hypothetical protein